MTKKMWKLLRFMLLVFLGMALLAIMVFAIYNEPLPKGTQGPEAEALATMMLKALDHDSYRNTRYLEWTYRNGKHKYKWDKKKGNVLVKWEEYTVKLMLNNTKQSKVFLKDEELEGAEKNTVLKKATAYFNNDSFWLVAPYKVFDQGTTRAMVKQADGSKALLVTYHSGGTTPGDSYLWKLQPNGFPIGFQMWVGILPIGGLEASWDDWLIGESGVFLPKSHDIGPITLDMGGLRGYND